MEIFWRGGGERQPNWLQSLDRVLLQHLSSERTKYVIPLNYSPAMGSDGA